jgi:rhodanese-related sulfurtransferase/mono/diheme cytochrome c family protein
VRAPSAARRLAATTLAAAALAACGEHRADVGPAPDQVDVHGAPSARRAAGAGLYARYCALCHAPDATGYAADHAPSLVSRTFLESASNDFLTRAIKNGRPGTAMAGYAKARGGPLEDDEVAALIEYLRYPNPSAIVPPKAAVHGEPARGEATWTRACQPCHGTKEKRGEYVHLQNPELLATASDGFLRHAIVNGRPGTPMPSFRALLDERELADVIAFVRGPAPAAPEKPAPRVPRSAAEVPANLPLIINPSGGKPSFTLREERYVPADQVKAALDGGKRIVILDARAPSDWLDGHIPGSVPAPYYDLAKLDAVPKDGTYIVAYCACPHHASGAVVDELRKRGFKQTAVLDEGILVWKQRGYPMASIEPPAGGAPPPPAAPSPGTSAGVGAPASPGGGTAPLPGGVPGVGGLRPTGAAPGSGAPRPRNL